MPGRASQLHQVTATLKVGEVAAQAETVREHVRRIIESPALKGSKRSQEFLQFVVDRALDGHCEELKERTLGVQLFGRTPSYDTGADAIVRVTACDVRRRLLQFYSSTSTGFEFRIELPLGSYIPEFRPLAASLPDPACLSYAPVSDAPAVISASIPDVPPVEVPPMAGDSAPGEKVGRKGVAVLAAYAMAGIGLCAAVWFGWQHFAVGGSSKTPLPWSSVIQPNGKTHIIFCDPEIVTIQRLLDYSVTLSDYANQKYWPSDRKPEVQSVIQSVSFRGVSVAAVDAAAATRISSLIPPGAGHPFETHPARKFRLTDFQTEDNFILFGSPRSNPWVGLYQEQLDFRFEFDPLRKSEFIRNARPRTGEPSTYVPTAEGWATGQAYAIVALVDNPNQKGHVLILAGSNAEATEAAARFATNLELVAQTLKSHGIAAGGPHQPFEVLLRVAAMAGSPNIFDVIACHRLPGKAR